MPHNCEEGEGNHRCLAHGTPPVNVTRVCLHTHKHARTCTQLLLSLSSRQNFCQVIFASNFILYVICFSDLSCEFSIQSYTPGCTQRLSTGCKAMHNFKGIGFQILNFHMYSFLKPSQKAPVVCSFSCPTSLFIITP